MRGSDVERWETLALQPLLRRSRRRGSIVAALTAAVVAAAGAVLADTVVTNEVVIGPGSTKGFVVTKGGPSITVNIRIQGQGGDGGPSGGGNCNATATTPITVQLSGLPSGVAATPISRTYSTCGADQSIAVSASNSAIAGDHAVIADATGGTGTTNDAAFTLRVAASTDTTAPVLSLPTDITEEATGPAGAAVAYTASASDAVDGSVPVDCTPASGSTFALGQTTVNCSATDNAGNTASGSFTVTVVDTTPPTLDLPDDITQEATGPAGAAVTYSASATDLVDGDVTVDCTPASGSTFALGQTTVNCSATDNAGNTATGSFAVTVVDTTPPTLDLPDDITVEATGSAGAMVMYSTSATDLVDGSVLVFCSPVSNSTFALGQTTVNCSATDNAGNTASGSFTVHVVYAFNGFFQPVNNPYAWNIPSGWNSAKAGSAIPVKFALGGDFGLAIFKAGYPKVVGVACAGGTTPDPIEYYTDAAGGSSLHYDASGGQYVYAWKTQKAWASSCFRFDLGLIDGSDHSFYVRFIK
jgi:hypothetical protein